jgi:hypothetical protein
MKKFVLFFVFLSSLLFSQTVSIYQPTQSEIIESGNWSPGYARLVYYIQPDLNWVDVTNYWFNITDITASTSTGWVACSYTGQYNLISAHSYSFQAKIYGYTFFDHHTAMSGVINFSVHDLVAPGAPSNLQITQSQNQHPFLTWDKNGELDFNNYKIYKRVGGEYAPWNYLNTVQNSPTPNYEDVTETYGTVSPRTPVDYRITAIDVNQNESIPSIIVTTYVSGGGLMKHGSVGIVAKIDNYSLKQNYPNPFNPSTLIQYTVLEPGLVKLEVYDILGNKVRELVNEVKGAGVYNAVFDATNLPSGIYICKINVNDFSATPKMSLLK